ncbi:TonB-dependent receptor [Carboxylicivirga sp. M1479]|uniref:SusC/RagA family TonB-linked outer membrane protein n=1 Tax=Carboxylicivirga sp. M1479 TaxID=2594476 RepID=UPI001178CC60|nr:TonB-dependent receptor [Carboxylicivirga sp. M1479]TRX71755.1 TonB-dependent receptor [Carboxylicivirga sp. M1479]
MKKILCGILLSIVTLASYAQNLRVEGIVTDSSTGESLPGVNVFIDGTQIGTVTNLDGYYTIDVSSGDATLVYSFIGMSMRKEAVNNRTKIDIALDPEHEQLDDVIVVAYGTTTKEAYTGAAQVVDNEIIEDRPVTSFEKALQGTTAGLQVTSSSGQPGSTAAVRIRGIGSLSASSSPLYVVDGVPMAGSLSDLNPNDIESLTVLKDAAAASLYGSRAANGVIMVTTKKGKAGKTSISFNGQVGVSSRIGDGYELMNSSQIYEQSWMGLYNWALYKDGQSLDEATQYAHKHVANTVGFNPFGVDNPLDDNGKVIPGTQVLTDTDWRDEVYKTGIIHNYNLNVAGGSENTKVYFSLGYFNDSGTTIGSDFTRYSAKLNVQHKVNDWISAGMSNHLSYSETNAPPGGGEGANPVRSAEIINAASPVYNPDGTFNWDNKAVYDFNPVGLYEYDQYEYETKRALTNAYLNFQLLPSLSFRTTGGIDYSGDKGLNYYNPYHGNGAGVNGRSTKASTENINWSISNIFSWRRQTGDSSIEVLAGQEATGSQYDVLQAGVTDFSVPFQPDLVWGGTPEMPVSYSSAWTMVSYLSQAKFNIKGRYNLSASVRSDGSSRFGENNKYGLFYSFGGGWHLSKEEWMPKLSWLNYAKLRASYGTSGNSSIGNYESYGLYGSGANYSGLPGLSPVQLENQDIQWEKNAAFNLGLETTLFNRLDASFEWYTRQSADLLFDKPLSASKGFPSIKTNLATMNNSGFEATLTYSAVRNTNFTYDISANFSSYTNEILDMTTDQIKSGTKLVEEGASLYQFYMREWAGVNPDNGTPMWYTNVSSDDSSNETEPGTSYTDPLGSGRQVTSEYSDAERVRLGLAIPDFFGGLSNQLTYKNIDFSFYFYYSIGGQVYNSDYASNMHDGSDPAYNLAVDAANAWTPNNRYTDVPRYIVDGTDNGEQMSSRYLEDASYLRLKNISIAYNLPQNICSKIRVQGLRIFASGENLWTLSNYKGFDPEGALSGTTSNSIPGTKVITFGVKMDL